MLLKTFCFVLLLNFAFGLDTCPFDCENIYSIRSQLAECETYEFKVSETKGTFNEVRAECFELGGDLIQKNFGPAGSKYHKEIEALVLQHGLLWIGYTDREKEGTWRFLDGELYDAHDTKLGGFCNWTPGEPNNQKGNQHCAKIWGGPALDDSSCDSHYHGLCEIKTSSCKVQ